MRGEREVLPTSPIDLAVERLIKVVIREKAI